MFIIHKFPSGPLSTNAYVVACQSTKHALIVDPAPESATEIFNCLSQHALTCQQIILTHSHWDHIADLSIVKKKLQVSIAIHAFDLPNLEKPGSDQLPCPFILPEMKADQILKHQDQIICGDLVFYIIHTPGHSPGSICLYEPKENILLSGDTLFQGSMGKVCFPTSQPNNMWQSLKVLALLPPETIVYPGHGPNTTIGKEKSWLSNAKEIFGY